MRWPWPPSWVLPRIVSTRHHPPDTPRSGGHRRGTVWQTVRQGAHRHPRGPVHGQTRHGRARGLRSRVEPGAPGARPHPASGHTALSSAHPVSARDAALGSGGSAPSTRAGPPRPCLSAPVPGVVWGGPTSLRPLAQPTRHFLHGIFFFLTKNCFLVVVNVHNIKFSILATFKCVDCDTKSLTLLCGHHRPRVRTFLLAPV